MTHRDDHAHVRDFDPEFDDVVYWTDEIDVVIDGARPGMLTEHGKISLLTKHCTNPDVRDEVRSWRTDGYTDEDGMNTVWANMTWRLAKEAMHNMFGGEVDRRKQAIDLISKRDPDGVGLKQNQTIPVHFRLISRTHQDAGRPFNWESEDLIDKQGYITLLADELADGMDGCGIAAPQQFVQAKLDEGYDVRRVRHLVAWAKSQDKSLSRESKRRGLGTSYWKSPSTQPRTKTKKKQINAVEIDGQQQGGTRMDKLESEYRSLKGELTKVQVDMQTGLETLKNDFSQRLTVMETKTDHNTKLQERTLALLEQQASPVIAQNNTMAYPQHAPQQAPQQMAPFASRQGNAIGWEQQKGASKGWKGRGKGSLLTRICYGCGQRGHIVRNCPVVNGQPGPQLTRTVNAIAGDMIAAVNHYTHGGIENLPVVHLHEQMGDADMEMEQTQVCSIAMEIVGQLLAFGEQQKLKLQSLRDWGQEMEKKLGCQTQTSKNEPANEQVNTDATQSSHSTSLSDSSVLMQQKANQPKMNQPAKGVMLRNDSKDASESMGTGSGSKHRRSGGKQVQQQLTQVNGDTAKCNRNDYEGVGAANSITRQDGGEDSWLECAHGAVRLTGQRSEPTGLLMERCELPDCVNDAEHWWATEGAKLGHSASCKCVDCTHRHTQQNQTPAWMVEAAARMLKAIQVLPTKTTLADAEHDRAGADNPESWREWYNQFMKGERLGAQLASKWSYLAKAHCNRQQVEPATTAATTEQKGDQTCYAGDAMQIPCSSDNRRGYNSDGYPPDLVDDDTSSSEDDEPIPDRLVKHPMELIEIFKKKKLVEQPENAAASADLTMPKLERGTDDTESDEEENDTDTDPQEDCSDHEEAQETFPVDLEAMASDVKRSLQTATNCRKKADQCQRVQGRRYRRGARHIGCGIAVAKQQRRITRYEGLLTSWMIIIALHAVAAASQMMQWHLVHTTAMALLAVPSMGVTMLSVETAIEDWHVWITYGARIMEYTAIALMMTEASTSWRTWLIELAVTLWMIMKASLQLNQMISSTPNSRIAEIITKAGSGLTPLLAVIWATVKTEDNIGLWMSAAATLITANVDLLSEIKSWWSEYWQAYYNINQICAIKKAMTVRFKCADGVTRTFLLDTGAAASLVRYSMFAKACTKLGLRPSKLRLSAANGKSMASKGTAVMNLWLPDQEMDDSPIISHAFEIMEDNAMPTGLQITGVDFWDRLQPDVMWSKRQVRCQAGGKEFTMPFSIEGERKIQVTAIAREKPDDHKYMALTEDLHLLPRQRAKVTVALDGEVCKEDANRLWAIRPTQLTTPGTKGEKQIHVALRGISQQNTEAMMQNQLRRETISIPAGTIIAIVSSHGSVMEALDSEMMDTADTTTARAVQEATLMEEAGALQAQQQGEQKEYSDMIQTVEETERWMKWSRPIRMGMMAAICIAWVAYAVWTFTTGSQASATSVYSVEAEENWQTSLAKTRQRIATLPEHHPLRATEQELRIKTEQFCSAEGGQAVYDKWKKDIANHFKYEQAAEEEREEYNKMLFQCRALFDANPKAPAAVKGVECALYLKDSNVKPRARPVPRLSLQEWKHMEKETDVMLKNGIIRFSCSDWAAVPVFAKKKDGTLRYAIDLRPLNECLLTDRLGMGNMDDILNSLGKQELYSTFDISAGFWGLTVREQDRKYLAFHAVWKGHWNLFEFNRMPFGCKNSTADFVRMYQKILGPTEEEPEGLIGKTCFVWVDDNIVFSSPEGETGEAAKHQRHRTAILKVLRRLVANGMSIKPSKCIWATTVLPFLGQLVVATQGVQPDPDKVKALAEATEPQCVSGLRTFMGQTVWLSKHVENYSALVAPLRKVVNKYNGCKTANIQHEWNVPKVRAAYSAMKIALCKPPVLRFPDFEKPFIILVDAAGGFGEATGGYGACLAQMGDDGTEHPIAYASTALNEAQSKFASTEAEASAAMFALRKWRAMVQGNVSILVSDHKAVSSLTKPTKEFKNRKLANWALEIADYDVVIAQRAGRIHFTPDFLSRHIPQSTKEDRRGWYEKAAGQVATIAHHSTVMQQFELLSAEAAEGRIKYQIKGAQLIDEEDDNGQPVASIQKLLDCIEAGDRSIREGNADPYEYSKLDEFYDMIATSDAMEKLSLERILESQKKDEFCRVMARYLEGGELKLEIEEDSDIDDDEDDEGGESGMTVQKNEKRKQTRALEEVIRSAPYFAIAETGVLVQLKQRKSKAKMRAAPNLEYLQRVYVPQQDKELQHNLVDAVHHETGHTGAVKTYQILLQRFHWKGMYTSVHNRVQACAKCQFYSVKAAKAPFLGHTHAVRCGQKIALDVIRLPKSEGIEYVLTAIDVFSRYAFIVPVADLKSETILRALRERVLLHGMGRPEVFLVDGGSEFKKDVQQAIDIWLSERHVHGAYRHEAAGCIEVFNKTIEKKIAMFCEEGRLESWIEVWPEAVEAYNATIQTASTLNTDTAFTPAELFLGRKLKFSFDSLAEEAMDTLLDSKPDTYFERMRKRTAQIVKTVKETRKEYLERMEKYDPQSKVQIRTFNIGQEVTLYAPTRSKKINKLSALQAGPYEVIDVDETGNMYRIKRIGSSKSTPKWVHLDQVKKFKRFMTQTEAQEIDEATPHAKQHEVVKIVGERGKTRRTKQFRVHWKQEDAITWEPATNLDHCKTAIRDWTMESPEEQEALTKANQEELKAMRLAKEAIAPAAVISQMKAQPAENADATATNVGAAIVTEVEHSEKGRATHIQIDLTPRPGEHDSLIRRIMEILGQPLKNLGTVAGSPPCETFSTADASNITRDNFHRDHSKKDKPPRSKESCKTPAAHQKRLKAIAHDHLVKQIVRSYIKDQRDGITYDMIMENPLGSLRQRPYMRGEAIEKYLHRETTNYCAYGKEYAKATDWWTSLAWTPKGSTGNGRCCNGACGQGQRKQRTGKFNHHKVIGGASDRAIKGPNKLKQLWEIPQPLIHEVMQVVGPAKFEGEIFMDLFSGGQSWKEEVMAKGYHYVSLDLSAAPTDSTDSVQ